MAEIGLDRPGVVGDFITAGMAQHVGMGFDDRIRSRNCPSCGRQDDRCAAGMRTTQDGIT